MPFLLMLMDISTAVVRCVYFSTLLVYYACNLSLSKSHSVVIPICRPVLLTPTMVEIPRKILCTFAQIQSDLPRSAHISFFSDLNSWPLPIFPTSTSWKRDSGMPSVSRLRAHFSFLFTFHDSEPVSPSPFVTFLHTCPVTTVNITHQNTLFPRATIITEKLFIYNIQKCSLVQSFPSGNRPSSSKAETRVPLLSKFATLIR